MFIILYYGYIKITRAQTNISCIMVLLLETMEGSSDADMPLKLRSQVALKTIVELNLFNEKQDTFE